MKRKFKDSLEYYVYNYDFNKKSLYRCNIFNSSLVQDIEKYLKDSFASRKSFKKYLDGEFKYYYWSRREYEISMGDLYEEDPEKYFKVSVYDQIEPNLDIIVDYVIATYNKIKRNKVRLYDEEI